LMVLLAHLPLPMILTSSPAVGLVERVRDWASNGVDFFFCLSGFLISGLLFAELQKTGSIRLGRFWLRRGLKIWPSYFVVYGTVLLFQMAHGFTSGIPVGLRFQLPNFVFLQNYIYPEHRWFASWSLAVEEHFYIICPLLLLLGVHLKKSWATPLLFCCICVAVSVFRISAVMAGVDNTLIYIQSHYRFDGFSKPVFFVIGSIACGIMISWLVERPFLRLRERIIP